MNTLYDNLNIAKKVEEDAGPDLKGIRPHWQGSRIISRECYSFIAPKSSTFTNLFFLINTHINQKLKNNRRIN